MIFFVLLIGWYDGIRFHHQSRIAVEENLSNPIYITYTFNIPLKPALKYLRNTKFVVQVMCKISQYKDDLAL